MGKIVGLLGFIAAVWCVLDIFKRPWDLVKKILISVLVLIFNWVGFIVYYLIKEKL